LGDVIWQPVLYLLGQGFIGGLAVGFAARKLNRVIAALVGVLIVALNILWFARMLGLETGLGLLKRLSDAIFNLLPFSGFDAQEEIRPMFLVATRIPFIAGFILGSAVGFKLA